MNAARGSHHQSMMRPFFSYRLGRRFVAVARYVTRRIVITAFWACFRRVA
jgi:hypothetical protein